MGPIDGPGRSLPHQFTVEMDTATSFIGFPYGSDGWNPLVRTLQEFSSDSSLRYEDSTLARLHRSFQPATLGEIFFGESMRGPAKELSKIGADRRFYRYIWMVDRELLRDAQRSEPKHSPNYYFGPHSVDSGRREFERLTSVFSSIRDRGFQPDVFGNVTGYFVADDSRCRFVVGAGNHRVAALAALGVDRFPARLHSHPAAIHRNQIRWWSHEHRGPYSMATAEALFDVQLRSSGTERAEELDLM